MEAPRKKRSLHKRLRRDAAYIVIVTLVTFFRILPRRAALAIGSFVGRMIPYVARKEYRLAVENLTIAFGKEKSSGDIEKLAHESFRYLALNFIDTVRLKVMTNADVINVTVPHGVDHLHSAFAEGKGIIGLTSHAGCWELLGVYLTTLNVPISAIAARLYDHRLEKMLVDNRISGGIKNISRGQDTREIIRSLKQGYLVGVLIDQDISKIRGDFIDFFGKTALTPTGPAILSLKYNVPIVPILTYRDTNHRHHACIGEPVVIERTGDFERDVSTLTAACSKVIEDFIREHPEQWVWFHRRWATRPPEEKTGETTARNDDSAIDVKGGVGV